MTDFQKLQEVKFFFNSAKRNNGFTREQVIDLDNKLNNEISNLINLNNFTSDVSLINFTLLKTTVEKITKRYRPTYDDLMYYKTRISELENLIAIKTKEINNIFTGRSINDNMVNNFKLLLREDDATRKIDDIFDDMSSMFFGNMEKIQQENGNKSIIKMIEDNDFIHVKDIITPDDFSYLTNYENIVKINNKSSLRLLNFINKEFFNLLDLDIDNNEVTLRELMLKFNGDYLLFTNIDKINTMVFEEKENIKHLTTEKHINKFSTKILDNLIEIFKDDASVAILGYLSILFTKK